MPSRGSTPGGESSGEHCSREASLRVISSVDMCFRGNTPQGGHVSEGESLGRISLVGMHFRGSTPQQGSPQGEHFSGGASLRGISSVGMHVRGALLQGDVLRGVPFRAISSVGMHCRGRVFCWGRNSLRASPQGKRVSGGAVLRDTLLRGRSSQRSFLSLLPFPSAWVLAFSPNQISSCFLRTESDTVIYTLTEKQLHTFTAMLSLTRPCAINGEIWCPLRTSASSKRLRNTARTA